MRESVDGNGKNRPTPKRRDAEAARKQPLIAANRAATGAKGAAGKAARKQAQAAAREDRIERRRRMLAGDEKYLATRDRGPTRRVARAAVDSRWNVGELLLPAMLLVLVFSLVTSSLQRTNPRLYAAVLALTYLVFIFAALDAVLLARRVKAHVKAELGEKAEFKGLSWYVIMRSFQLRRSRVPQPQVTRRRFFSRG